MQKSSKTVDNDSGIGSMVDLLIDWMLGCIDVYARSNKAVIPYSNFTYIQKYTIKVCIKILANMNIVTVITTENRLYITIFSH